MAEVTYPREETGGAVLTPEEARAELAEAAAEWFVEPTVETAWALDAAATRLCRAREEHDMRRHRDRG